MDGPFAGLGVHTLAEEAEVLHLLTHQTSGQAQFLCSHHDLQTPDQPTNQPQTRAEKRVNFASGFAVRLQTGVAFRYNGQMGALEESLSPTTVPGWCTEDLILNL